MGAALHYPLGGRSPDPGTLVEVAPGIGWWQTLMPGPLRQVNGYVLRGGGAPGGTALVDAGVNTDAGLAGWQALLGGALAGEAVGRVVATHHHPDHVGLAGWLCRTTGAPLVMTRAEWLYARLLAADRQDAVPAEVIAFWRRAGWDERQLAEAGARGWGNFARLVSRLPLGFTRVADGDVLSIGGAEWQVVVGAGHSPEHACLLDRDRRVLVAGDQVLPRISSNVSLTVSEPGGDPLGDWLASIARLRALPDDLLVLPGHGEPFRGLHARLDALAGEHAERLDRVADALAEPRRAPDLFPQLFRRPIDDPLALVMATGEALAHLRRLERERRATREERDGVWWWRRG